MNHLFIVTICLFLCMVSGVSRGDSVVYWNTDASEKRVATSGLTFTLQEDPWLPVDENDEDSQWIAPYQVDFTIDSEEGGFPQIQKLELFELLGYGGAVDSQLQESQVWGVVTNESGAVLGAAAASVLNSEDPVTPLTFDFSESMVILETGVSYMLRFVCSDSSLEELGISVGGMLTGRRDAVYLHLSEIVIEDDGWESVYNTNSNLDYLDSDESIAPAVSISTIATEVPEPVSGSLSLLALCGMLLRRRR